MTARVRHWAPSKSRRRRLLLTIAAIVVLVPLALGAGAYAWLAVTLSEANNRPGMDEARQALAEPLPPSTATPTSATLGGAGAAPEPSEAATATSAVTSTTAAPTTTATTFDPGKPGAMNILVLGADRAQSQKGSYGRSDTMMLVHVDPDAGFVSVLSLPRDLQVDLGSHGTQKLNAAYAFGGDALAIRTIRNLTGLRIDHYVRVDFAAFSAIIDELGGIYVDVDRYYYDDGHKLLRIDLQAGYQRLAGDASLRYVRTRHDRDHDWARIRRQQRFLRAAKEQVYSWDMATRIPSVVSTVMEYVATEIGPTDAIRLAWWGVHLNTSRIKQVALQGQDLTIDGIAYVVSSDRQIRAAVTELMTPPEREARREGPGDLGPRDTAIDLTGIQAEVLDAGAGQATTERVAAFLTGHGARVLGVDRAGGQPPEASTVVYSPQMERSLTVEAAQVAQALGIRRSVEDNSLRHVRVYVARDLTPPNPAATVLTVEQALWRRLAEQAAFPVEAPGWIPPGFVYGGSRVYAIETDGGEMPALSVTYAERGEDEYVALMETMFTAAPVATPGEEVVDGGTTFTTVYAGLRAERVWWMRNDCLYWLSNTLDAALSPEQLLKMATSMTPVRPPGRPGRGSTAAAIR